MSIIMYRIFFLADRGVMLIKPTTVNCRIKVHVLHFITGSSKYRRGNISSISVRELVGLSNNHNKRLRPFDVASKYERRLVSRAFGRLSIGLEDALLKKPAGHYLDLLAFKRSLVVFGKNTLNEAFEHEKYKYINHDTIGVGRAGSPEYYLTKLTRYSYDCQKIGVDGVRFYNRIYEGNKAGILDQMGVNYVSV
jgi:hypothetical protein